MTRMRPITDDRFRGGVDWRRDAILAGEAGLWRWDHRQQTAQLCSGAAQLLTGDYQLAWQELSLDDAFSRLQPDDIERLRLTLGATVSYSRPPSDQLHILSGEVGGRRLLMRGRTQIGTQGEPVATHGIIVDTTDSRIAEDEWFSSSVHGPLDEAAHHGVAAYNAIQATGLASLLGPARALLLAIGREIATGMKGRRSH